MGKTKHTRQADIAWLKTAVNDSYYESCAQKFVIAEFDDIYTMISELLTGLDVRAIVIDTSAIFDAYNSVIVPLANSGVTNNILLYSLRPVFSSARPNGRTPNVKFASSQLELCKTLIEIFSNKSSVSKEQKEEKGENLSEQESIVVKEEKKQEDNQEISDKPFVAAELTPDELQALLGPDYLLDISSGKIKEGKENKKK